MARAHAIKSLEAPAHKMNVKTNLYIEEMVVRTKQKRTMAELALPPVSWRTSNP